MTPIEEYGRWGPYRQASPPPARHRPGARSARRQGRRRESVSFDEQTAVKVFQDALSRDVPGIQMTAFVTEFRK